MQLGIDCFSLRFNQWNAFQLLDFAADTGIDVVHFSEHAPLESLDSDYLRQVKAYADQRGLGLEMGMWSICPTSTSFRSEDGAAVDQLSRMLNAAHAVGSPALRCILGTNADRHTDLPLAAHMDAVVDTCRAVREQAMDLGIKIAIENHAGDMQGRELKALIEAAGPEYVGACIDTGNPLWVAESPFVTLDHLAPYVVMSHIRDTVLSTFGAGATAQWVPMGEGNVKMAAWAQRFQQECPAVNFTLEIITSLPPKVLNVLDPGFWAAYPETPAGEFAQFLALATAGEPYAKPILTASWGEMSDTVRAAVAEQERAHVEQSVRYCRDELGIGA